METWEQMRTIVKQRMDDQGTKQKFLAKKCGFTEKDFSLLLNGRKTITETDIKKFCLGMGVCPNDLVKLDDTA